MAKSKTPSKSGSKPGSKSGKAPAGKKPAAKKAAGKKAPATRPRVNAPKDAKKKKALALPKLSIKPAKKTAKPAKAAGARTTGGAEEALRNKVIAALDAMKAEDVVCVDVRGQSSLTDFMVIASGRSNRQVKSLAETARDAFMKAGIRNVRIEGAAQSDWVVVDGGDVIVHLFRPEVRLFYRLEEVWGLEPPLHETFKNL